MFLWSHFNAVHASIILSLRHGVGRSSPSYVTRSDQTRCQVRSDARPHPSSAPVKQEIVNYFRKVCATFFFALQFGSLLAPHKNRPKICSKLHCAPNPKSHELLPVAFFCARAWGITVPIPFFPRKIWYSWNPFLKITSRNLKEITSLLVLLPPFILHKIWRS